MHIPKASGTSVALGLRAALGAHSPIRGFDHVLFGGFTGFDTFSPQERKVIYDRHRTLPSGAPFVAGHFAYTTLRAASPGAQLVTFLREPVCRLLSHWMFWRQTTDQELAGVGAWADYVRVARGTLSDFLTSPRIAAQTDNLAVRMLVWPHDLVPLDGFIDHAHDRQLLRLAQERLQRFSLAGIVEAPDFANRISAWLGQDFTYAHRNETAAMPAALRVSLAAELDRPVLERLEASSRLDLALWTSLARRHGGATYVAQTRRLTILQHVARYGALMAA